MQQFIDQSVGWPSYQLDSTTSVRSYFFVCRTKRRKPNNIHLILKIVNWTYGGEKEEMAFRLKNFPNKNYSKLFSVLSLAK